MFDPCIICLQEKLKVVTIFGAGLLVGTALTVIIPEGIRALYSEVVTNDEYSLSAIKGSPTEADDAVLLSSKRSNDHKHQNEHSATIGLSLVLGKLTATIDLPVKFKVI